MALPALVPEGAIAILAESPDPDGRGLAIAFSVRASGTEPPERHLATCRFREPGRPRESRDLVALTLDGEALREARLFALVRYWLATPEGRAADPAPFGDLSRVPDLPAPTAYAVQMAIDGLPLAAIYALLAAAYSLVYGLIGRINFAFGELAAAGGYGASMTALMLAGLPPAPLLAAAFFMAGVVALGWGFATARCVFIPLRKARGQQMLVATVGLAIFLQELLRIAQGDRASWMAPVLNQPFALARAPDYVAVASPMTFVASGVALGVALALVVLFRWTRAGREWRAYADDPLAAEMLGVSPAATTARALALSGALAGLAGAIMTAGFGAVGYALSATLTLKALAAAIVGGIGSLPGAFLGGLVIGVLETSWSAVFPIDDRDLAVYALLILFIALRPAGLLGSRDRTLRDLRQS
jgi:branched-subunit amino acid ABC-type transport system permease component